MKKIAVSILIAIFLIIIALVLYINLKERKIIVFAYHKIVPNEIKEKYYSDNIWVDTTENFERQMKFLYDNNYKTLSMKEYKEWRDTDKKYPIKTVMITIDDGDIETYYEIKPILEKYNLKATAFIIGEKVEETSEEYNPKKQQFLGRDLIEKSKQEYPDLEFHSHSYGLHQNDEMGSPIGFKMTKNEISEDFNKMKAYNTNIYCYPYGKGNEIVHEVLEEQQYEMAFMLDKSKISRKSDQKYLISRVGINSETSFTMFKKWLLKQYIM